MTARVPAVAVDRRGIGETWNPFPQRLAKSLNGLSWSKENPAPEPLVWAWAYEQLRQGEEVSGRGLARYAGWGTTRGGRVFKEVVEAFAKWSGNHSRDTIATPPRHPQPVIVEVVEEPRDTCETPATHQRDTDPPANSRARDKNINNNNSRPVERAGRPAGSPSGSSEDIRKPQTSTPSTQKPSTSEAPSPATRLGDLRGKLHIWANLVRDLAAIEVHTLADLASRSRDELASQLGRNAGIKRLNRLEAVLRSAGLSWSSPEDPDDPGGPGGSGGRRRCMNVSEARQRAIADWNLISEGVRRFGRMDRPRRDRGWIFDNNEATHHRILTTLERAGLSWLDLCNCDSFEFRAAQKRFVMAWPGGGAQ